MRDVEGRGRKVYFEVGGRNARRRVHRDATADIEAVVREAAVFPGVVLIPLGMRDAPITGISLQNVIAFVAERDFHDVMEAAVFALTMISKDAEHRRQPDLLAVADVSQPIHEAVWVDGRRAIPAVDIFPERSFMHSRLLNLKVHAVFRLLRAVPVSQTPGPRGKKKPTAKPAREISNE